MKEITGDMFSVSLMKFADVICITTNGFVKKNGRAVMGAGNAKRARDLFENIDLDLGRLIRKNGNVVQIMRYIQGKKLPIISFPVKYNWWEKASLDLIDKSMRQLLKEATINGWKKIILPRPGCMNGGLSWMREVKPLLEKYLDERIYIIDRIKQ